MIISYCVPVMNRTYDLKVTLPRAIEAANESPPVEISVLNYGSVDDLEEYIFSLPYASPVTYGKIEREYYHVSHARNLAILQSAGEYFINASADTLLKPEFFSAIRKRIEQQRPVWMSANYLGGVFVCRRDEFIDAGGFDERIELYGCEDTEMMERLTRRGGKWCSIPQGIARILPTPRDEKVRNFRVKDHMTNMSRMMRPIIEESRANGTVVANPGGWGQWT